MSRRLNAIKHKPSRKRRERVRLTAASVLKMKCPRGKDRIEIFDALSPVILIIQDTQHKSFAVRYRWHGRFVKLTLGPLILTGTEMVADPVIGGPQTLVSARALAAEVKRQLALGHNPAETLRRERLERNAGLSKTFDGAAIDFTEQHLRRNVRRWQRAARLIGVAPDVEGKLYVMRKGLADRWRDKPLTAITADDLHWFIDECKERSVPGLRPSGNRQSEAMAHQAFSTLRTMFRWLLEKRRIKSNPFADLIGPKASKQSRDRFLSDAEIVKFWTACDHVDEPAAQCLRLLLLTGARLNEIAMLSRGEVEDHIVTIPASRSKNKVPHVVPLPPSALAILRSIKTNGDLYFIGKSGRPIGPWSRVKRKLDANMKPDAPFVLHDLRRTVSTGMNEIGIEPNIVEAVLNHVSGHRAGVAGTYNRAKYLEQKETALRRWADHIDGLVSGRTSKVVTMKRRH